MKSLHCLYSIVVSLLLGAVFAVPYAHAEVDEDVQLWAPMFLNTTLGEKGRATLEVQPRFGNDISQASMLLVRPVVGYQVTPNVSLWQGYGWTPSFNPYRNEHRIFQQALINHKIRKLQVQHRLRLEERFIENMSSMVVRGRWLVRGDYPLGASEKWGILGYNELFINATSTSTGPQQGFDRNRLYGGISRKLNPHTRVDVGYVMEYANQPLQVRDRINHIINLWLTVNF